MDCLKNWSFFQVFPLYYREIAKNTHSYLGLFFPGKKHFIFYSRCPKGNLMLQKSYLVKYFQEFKSGLDHNTEKPPSQCPFISYNKS